ncbi:protein TILLER ANGLE CONTROL 1-like isoform X1 [Musa acuminata AAA Group]|uniref:protein TILLER ANGLE CONTROL 1-like isoform X1 n=2 Tax=Musa acuminata AAA Group TaxID=214697 RepID=UPI0031D9F113
MKIIFDWMRRKLHPSVKYSQVSRKKDAFGGDDEEKQEVVFEGLMEKEPLLLHDVLDGILTIGTLGHQGNFLSRSYSIQEDHLLQEDEADTEVEEREEGTEVAPAIIESIKVKPPVEAEVKEVTVVVKDVEESPLLEEDKKKRERGRTTLADLFAAENLNEGANANRERKKTAKTKKQEKRTSPCTAKAKAKANTTTNTKLQKLMTKMLKKKIHPEIAVMPKSSETQTQETRSHW